MKLSGGLVFLVPPPPPTPPSPFSFFSLRKRRNLFLPSSLNWMQFIAFPKLVFHRQWQPMRICLLNVASGANMRKVAGGDAVGGGGVPGQKPIHDQKESNVERKRKERETDG